MHIYDISFFLRTRSVSKFAEKIRTHILGFRQSSHLRGNVETYGRAREATGDNRVRRIHIACWVAKATDTPSEYVIDYFLLSTTKTLRKRASVLCLYLQCLSCIVLRV